MKEGKKPSKMDMKTLKRVKLRELEKGKYTFVSLSVQNGRNYKKQWHEREYKYPL